MPLPSQNAFLIVDFAPDVHRLRTAIRSLDAPRPGTAPEPGLADRVSHLITRVDKLIALVQAAIEEKR